MSGYVFLLGPCLACGTVFSYNPNKVPSVRVNAQGEPDPTGRREPLCRGCAERLNARRRELGLSTWTITDEAYEAAEEGEVGYE